MAIDQFPGQPLVDAPVSNAVLVTPSDTTDLQYVCRALYIGNTTFGSSVEVIMQGGQDVTFQNLQQGQILPIRCSRIKAAGTTASGIVALY